MNKLEFIITGEVISKKNGQKIIRLGKFPSLRSGDAYLKWEKAALQEMQFKRIKWEGDYPVELHVFFHRKTRRAFDFSNMLESVQDMLVKGGILPTDDFLHVIPVIMGAALDKDHPRVNVTIVPATRTYNTGFLKQKKEGTT